MYYATEFSGKVWPSGMKLAPSGCKLTAEY